MGSLKDCGLDEEIPNKNGFRVRLTFQDSFAPGDGLSWSYLSRTWPTFDLAQREACLDILCLLLWCAPLAVHIAPGSMKHDRRSIHLIRAAARQLKEARQQDCVELILGPIGALDPATPARQRPARAPRANVPAYEPVRDPGHIWDREEEVLAVLRRLAGRSKVKPGKVPLAIRFELARLLPRGSLKTFLKSFPTEFTVHEDDEPWTFTVHRGGSGSNQGMPGSVAGTQGVPASSAGNPGTSAGNASSACTQGVPASSAGNPGTSAGNAWSAGTQVVPGSSAGNTSSAGAWDNWTTWHGWPVWKWLEWNEWNAGQGESGEWNAGQGESAEWNAWHGGEW